MLILFCPQLVVGNELKILRMFLREDEISPPSLVQSRKWCLVDRAGGTPKMVSKNPVRERWGGSRGRGWGVAEGVNYSLMNYTKEKRW